MTANTMVEEAGETEADLIKETKMVVEKGTPVAEVDTEEKAVTTTPMVSNGRGRGHNNNGGRGGGGYNGGQGVDHYFPTNIIDWLGIKLDMKLVDLWSL